MNHFRRFSLFLLLSLFMKGINSTTILTSAYAVENDQYVAWGADIEDSVDVLNEYINRHIRIVIGAANRGLFPYTCQGLTFKIGWHFSRGGIKMTDLWAENNPEIEKFPANREDLGRDGVYRNIKKLRHAGRTINVNGVHIGVDKLSHTMAMGFVYWVKYHHALKKYKRIYRGNLKKAEERAMEDAINVGIWSEKTYTGLNKFASGMFSFADMESNFQGLQIYRSLCEGKSPRLKRFGFKRWKFVGEPIDFRDYVNPYWNEIFNPNYHAKRTWVKVSPLLKEYCQRGQEPAKMAELERYKNWAAQMSPSFSLIYLDQQLEKGCIPDPRPQKLENICGQQGGVTPAIDEDEEAIGDEAEKVTAEEEEASRLDIGEFIRPRTGIGKKESHSPSEFFHGHERTVF